MNSTKKEPSSAPPSYPVNKQREQDLKTWRRNSRQDPCSDPTGRRRDTRDIDSLSDEQLRKLTKANTRRNHGGRSSRLRSQVERVFRRLDNLAADVKLQPRYSIEALPLVNPDNPSVITQNESTNARQSNDDAAGNSDQHVIVTSSDFPGNHAVEKNLTTKLSYGSDPRNGQIPLDNEEFEIEPATNNSAFTDYANSTGTPFGSARSVRISTSVTILDYKESEAVSISRLQRHEHPTRTGKCLQTRKSLSKMNVFPRAMQRFDQNSSVDHLVTNRDVQSSSGIESKGSREVEGPQPDARLMRSAGQSPISFIMPSPTGPYRSGSESTGK